MYLIDVTLACEDANSKLVVEVVTVADVDDEDLVCNRFFFFTDLGAEVWSLSSTFAEMVIAYYQ